MKNLARKVNKKNRTFGVQWRRLSDQHVYRVCHKMDHRVMFFPTLTMSKRGVFRCKTLIYIEFERY